MRPSCSTKAWHLFLAFKLEACGREQWRPVADVGRLSGHRYLGGGEDVAAVRPQQPTHFAERGDRVGGEEDRVQTDNRIRAPAGQAGGCQIADEETRAACRNERGGASGCLWGA